VTHGV